MIRPAFLPSDRLAIFFQCIERLNGRTYDAPSRADALRFVDNITQGRRSIASNSPLLRDIGIDKLPGVASGIESKATLREHCAAADFGISGASYALADTGTLVMLSGREEARMISLLPPVHIAIVDKSKIFDSLDDLLLAVPLPAELTSSMVLITGPSRTGDIEQILVRGVHGPGELYVITI
jgi:L-lactate dehydrogenase complex protein LldG